MRRRSRAPATGPRRSQRRLVLGHRLNGSSQRRQPPLGRGAAPRPAGRAAGAGRGGLPRGLEPHRRARREFVETLEVTRRYTVICEKQARTFSQAWPRLRSCALSLGADLAGAGHLERADDVFFLRRSELDEPTDHRRVVAARHARWQRQRLLQAPFALGAPPRIVGDPITRAVARARGDRPLPPGALRGEPASAGRATGRVRIHTARNSCRAANPARSSSRVPPHQPGHRCSRLPRRRHRLGDPRRTRLHRGPRIRHPGGRGHRRRHHEAHHGHARHRRRHTWPRDTSPAPTEHAHTVTPVTAASHPDQRREVRRRSSHFVP